MSVNVQMQNGNLPQMKSIWLDEDQEAEKLYGLQAQRLMDSSSDEEEIPDIQLVHSDKPMLNNKQNIELPGLRSKSPSRFRSAYTSKKNNKKNKFFKKLFGSSRDTVDDSKRDASSIKMTISTPYGFQHISHAGTTPEEEVEQPVEEDVLPPLVSCDPGVTKPKPLSSIFVTQSIPHDNISTNNGSFHHMSRRSSKRISLTSSVYSSATGSSNAQNDRIMSSSTMATTILDRAFTPQGKSGAYSRSRSSSMHSFERRPSGRPVSHIGSNNLASHSRSGSVSTNEEIQFLKDYSFPTLLEEDNVDNTLQDPEDRSLSAPVGRVPAIPDAHRSNVLSFLDTPKQFVGTHTPSHSISSGIVDTPASDIKRRNSMPLPQNMSTPELEKMLFKDSTPKSSKRVSLDDVIKYYDLSSSATECPSTFASPYL